MIAAEIAAVLGAAHRSGQWWRCVCPIHGSRTGRSATLAVRDGARRLVIVCHAGCSRAAILDELRRRGLLGGGAHPAPAAVADCDARNDVSRRIDWARRIWAEARDAHGSPVVRYLEGRGITMPVSPSLRWAPSLRRPDGSRAPAMVARVDGLNGELVGVHRTHLNRDDCGRWHRHDRASLGPIAGGAVRLAPAAETLLIAEGIETALAAMQAATQPAWAALSAGGIARLGLPPIVRTVVILADHDRSGTGERAARTAAQRWLPEGRRVRVAMPPELGTDFNDLLAGRRCAQIAEVGDAA